MLLVDRKNERRALLKINKGQSINRGQDMINIIAVKIS